MDTMLLLILMEIMLRNDPKRTHYNTHEYILKLPMEERENVIYKEAWFNYLDAKHDFFSSNTNWNLMKLVGTHSRWHKMVQDMDEKYRSKLL